MGRRNRVLIYRLGSLGDTVVALPGFHLVARAFPDAERRLLTNFPVQSKAPPAAAVLDGTGLVHGYFRYRTGTRRILELVRLWWAILRWHPQVLVYLGPARGVETARRDARFFRMCGIRRLIGVPMTADMQSRQVTDASFGRDVVEPEAQRLVRNLAELGEVDLEDRANWELALTDAERARAGQVVEAAGGRPLIAVSIGTKLQANDWGLERWAELAGRLAQQRPGYAFAVTGAAVDRESSESLIAAWRGGIEGQAAGGPSLNLCGDLTPRESAAVFARASVFLGHDSGPMHLAAAVGTPCVAIFGARGKPRLWFPYGVNHRVLYRWVDCAGCGLETCVVEGKRCILSIQVDDVMREVEAVLAVRQ